MTRRTRLIVAAGGAIVGVILRNAPIYLAALIVDDSSISCRDRGPLECAFGTGPRLLLRLLELFLVAACLSLLMLVVGLLVMVFGRRRPLPFAAGVAIVVPPLWFCGVVASALLTP